MRDLSQTRSLTPVSREEEHIDRRGHLRVPVAHSLSPAPLRPGWQPFFVNVNLKHPIQKVIIYKRSPEGETAA